MLVFCQIFALCHIFVSFLLHFCQILEMAGPQLNRSTKFLLGYTSELESCNLQKKKHLPNYTQHVTRADRPRASHSSPNAVAIFRPAHAIRRSPSGWSAWTATSANYNPFHSGRRPPSPRSGESCWRHYKSRLMKIQGTEKIHHHDK